MKFEVKTDNKGAFENVAWPVFLSIMLLITIISAIISINLTRISRIYEINYFCKVIFIDKSSKNFKKLSKLTKHSNKQKIWDLCKKINDSR